MVQHQLVKSILAKCCPPPPPTANTSTQNPARILYFGELQPLGSSDITVILRNTIKNHGTILIIFRNDQRAPVAVVEEQRFRSPSFHIACSISWTPSLHGEPLAPSFLLFVTNIQRRGDNRVPQVCRERDLAKRVEPLLSQVLIHCTGLFFFRVVCGVTAVTQTL